MSSRGWTPRNRSLAAVLVLACAFFLRGVFLALVLPYGDPLDEPFHYGYAAYLSATGRVPRAGLLTMPADALRPMASLPRSTPFPGPHPSWEEFAGQTLRERTARREEAFAFRPAERVVFVTPNYETQQPPLAYFPAAGILKLLSAAPLDLRLLLLRLTNALAAAIAVVFAWLFFRRVLPANAATAAVTAYVAFPGVGSFVGRFSNDAVALPIATALLCLFADAARGRLSRRGSIVLALLLAAGCWIKLYFLPLLPTAPLAALLSPRGKRAVALRRSLGASVFAFLLFVPWMIHQKSSTGDWMGLTPSKLATELGLGLSDRWNALPTIVRPRFAIVFGRTFLWPGTWSAMGAPAALAVILSVALVLLLLIPSVTGARQSRRRTNAWRAGGLAVMLFLGAQVAYASTLAAIGRARGQPPSAGPDGWYLLLLLPVILTAACVSGRKIAKGVFVAAAAVFLAGEWWLTLGVLPGVYGGATVFNGANFPLRAYGAYMLSPGAALRVFERVGLAAAPRGALLAVLLLWLLALVSGAFLAARPRRTRNG